MSLDSRGVLRGSCLECACTGYYGGEEKKKCIKCFHPPGKHKNLSEVGRSGSTSYASTVNSMGSYTHTTPHSFGNHNFGGALHVQIM